MKVSNQEGLVSRKTTMLAGLAFVAGCASTALTSLPAPEARGRVFHHVLVVAAVADLDQRQATELRMASHSVGGAFDLVPGYTILFPGREYTKEEVAAVLHAHNIDATLVIQPSATGATPVYVPPTYVTSCTSWNAATGCGQTTTTQVSGGDYALPWARFVASLYDAATGNSIWIATATTRGNIFADDQTLANSMADETVTRLIADGLLSAAHDSTPTETAKPGS